MSKVKVYFQNIGKNMPKHTRWILLAIALVLCVMIILLLSGGKEDSAKGAKTAAEVSLNADPKTVDFGTVLIGQEKTQEITVSATAPAVVSGVTLHSETPGLSVKSNTCEKMGKITDKLTCDVTLAWNPTALVTDGKNIINIKYYDANGSKDMEKMATVEVKFVSNDETVPKEEPATEPVDKGPALVEEDKPFVEDLPELPAPIAVEPEPMPEPKAVEPEPAPAAATGEECFRFAFPGYNNAGKQIGWIKPSGGHYMFHPFDDKDCSKPTGEYNPNTGFIMSVDDASKKLGSDAEHIGGRGAGANIIMPVLSNPPEKKTFNRARQSDTPAAAGGPMGHVMTAAKPQSSKTPSSYKPGTQPPEYDQNQYNQATVSSVPYDRTFVLRHFKPIPATIVNEIRAVESNFILPVQATVDRHVYSDNGRTIVVPAGTLILGSVTGDMPGPYKTIGRINIEWYRFIRPDGVEFNFVGEKPFSGDSQGRVGVPGYGSTDYLEQMVLPLVTAIVPAMTNMIAPISDKIVNQIDLDNNVVVQQGQMRSSELAKQELIRNWNKVTEKFFIDMMDNTKPPFSIASGTRITIYSPTDLIVAWCDEGGENCIPEGVQPSTEYARAQKQMFSKKGETGPGIITIGAEDPQSLIGQVAAYGTKEGDEIKDARMRQIMEGYKNYQSKSMAANAVYNQQLNAAGGIIQNDGSVLQQGTKAYNENVLGLTYTGNTITAADGSEIEQIANPNDIFSSSSSSISEEANAGLLCDGGIAPDSDGCCPGETFTDMGDAGQNCCPDGGGDCFPPIVP